MKKLLGGLVGALALNLIHETYRRFDDKAPRVDLVGEETLRNIIEATGNEAPTGNRLYASTLVGDVVSNALYFSLIGFGKKKNLITRGAIFGAAAGVGTVIFTKDLGLRDAPVNRFTRTKVLTVSWYLIGGLVTAASIKGLNQN
ncbi:MAG: hypothetical protein M3Z26_06550 [Bacteroidota bacterium]|nr:hypothetical protein [Bacteroidota bacterium]